MFASSIDVSHRESGLLFIFVFCILWDWGACRFCVYPFDVFFFPFSFAAGVGVFCVLESVPCTQVTLDGWMDGWMDRWNTT